MKQLSLALIVCSGLAANPIEVLADAWPRLSSRSNHTRCAEALKIAKAAFDSNAFYIYAPPPISTAGTSVVVLQPAQTDVSGGAPLHADENFFLYLPTDNHSREIYWQKKASRGVRVAVEQKRFNWQGDTYALFTLKPDVTPDYFLSDRKKSRPEFVSIIDGWRPPLVLEETRSGQPWARRRSAVRFLAEWGVYLSHRRPHGIAVFHPNFGRT